METVLDPQIEEKEKGWSLLTSSVKQWFTNNGFLGILSILLLIAVLIFLAIYFPKFYKTRNLINIFTQASATGIMAIGMTAVLIGGGIDLSIPFNMALSAVVGATTMQATGSPFLGVGVMLIVSIFIGCLNGFAVAYLKMIPFVVTLAMMQLAGGVTLWITNMASVPVPYSFVDTILFRVGKIPLPVFAFIAIAILAAIYAKKSLFGRWLYAVGTNPKSARVAGIPSQRVLFGTYVFSGLCAGLTAIILSARLASAGHPMASNNVVLDVVSSAVVGGVSIYGGIGGPIGASLGAIAMTVINNAMNFMRVDFFPSQIVKGAIIIVFVYLDSLRHSRR